MKSYTIVWRPQARDDLLALYEWIAEQADPDTAFEYTRLIEAHATKLANFPERGTPREGLAAGPELVEGRATPLSPPHRYRL